MSTNANPYVFVSESIDCDEMHGKKYKYMNESLNFFVSICLVCRPTRILNTQCIDSHWSSVHCFIVYELNIIMYYIDKVHNQRLQTFMWVWRRTNFIICHSIKMTRYYFLLLFTCYLLLITATKIHLIVITFGIRSIVHSALRCITHGCTIYCIVYNHDCLYFFYFYILYIKGDSSGASFLN